MLIGFAMTGCMRAVSHNFNLNLCTLLNSFVSSQQDFMEPPCYSQLSQQMAVLTCSISRQRPPEEATFCLQSQEGDHVIKKVVHFKHSGLLLLLRCAVFAAYDLHIVHIFWILYVCSPVLSKHLV